MNPKRRVRDWLFPPPRAVRAGRAGAAAMGLARVTAGGRLGALIVGAIGLAFVLGLGLGLALGLLVPRATSGDDIAPVPWAAGSAGPTEPRPAVPTPPTGVRAAAPAALPTSAAAPTLGTSLPSAPSGSLPPPTSLTHALAGHGSGETLALAAPARSLDPACGPKRYCKQMASCAEARLYLTRCGLSRLDRDGDGTPCESLCEKKARRSR